MPTKQDKACPSAPNIARRKLSQREWTHITRRGAVLAFCAAPRDAPAAQAKKQDTPRRSQKSRAPPCPPPQPPPRERHAPKSPARRRYAPRARPQKCSRRTGETVTTKTTYAGSQRARKPQRPRLYDCGTAAHPPSASARPKPTTRRDRRHNERQKLRPRVLQARPLRPPLGERI